jgi:hypothetical protein
MAQVGEKTLSQHVEVINSHNSSKIDLETQKVEEKYDPVTFQKSRAEREAAIAEISAKQEKRILRKVDWRLVPLLTLLYLVAFVDRSNSKSPREIT